MEKVTFICDWCRDERTEGDAGVHPHTIVQRDGWITGLDVETKLREGREHANVSTLFLFPPEMRQEKTETKDFHFESTLCDACVEALQEAVVATRAHRKTRPAKTKTP